MTCGASDVPRTRKDAAKRVALYARVSTNGQDTANQLDELREVAERAGWTVAGVYEDKGISGAKGRDHRPALDRMLKDATRREFDVVACWSIDRLGRSTKHLADTCEDLHALGVGLYFHKQAVDTTTPTGKLFFTVLSGVAEFERELIRERVVAGLARAKKRGKRLGRPRTVTPSVARRVRIARERGASLRTIAKDVGTSVASVRRVLAGEAGGDRK